MPTRSIDLALKHGDPRLQLGERERVEIRLDQRGQGVVRAKGGIILFHHGMQR